MLRIVILLASVLSCINMYGHGEIHDRINLVTEEISQSPNDPVLYIKRGSLYMDDGDYDKTFLDIEAAKALAGEEYPPTMFLLAKMCFKMETYDIALRHINSFLSKEEGHVLGLLTKAKILTALEENDEAANFYQQAIEKTTTLLPENFMDLINVQIEAGQLDAAYQNYELAQMKFGNLLVFDLKAIEISEARSDFNTIHQILDDIIESQQRKERWHYKKAEYYLKAGEYEASIKELNLANESLLLLPYRIRITPAMQELSKNISAQEQNIKTLLNANIITTQTNEN
ncbi:MAG: hypothetical protein R2753_03120 [Chitinophagales bacterium]